MYQFEDAHIPDKSSALNTLTSDLNQANKRAKKSHNALQVINPPLSEDIYAFENSVNVRKTNLPVDKNTAAAAVVNEVVDAARLQQQKLEREVQAYSSRSFIVPSCSAWFHLDQIHEIEM